MIENGWFCTGDGKTWVRYLHEGRHCAVLLATPEKWVRNWDETALLAEDAFATRRGDDLYVE